MKTCTLRSFLPIVVGALCVSLCPPIWAEVSTDPLPRRRARTLMMDFTYTGITDGADPIPSISWQIYRNLPAGQQLNRSGALRPDGRPDLIYRPILAAPLVVWAYNNGAGEHDIAFASWENDQWGPTRFLTTNSTENEIDPRLFYGNDGTVYIVWAAQSVSGEADSRIMLATRTPAEPDGNGDLQPAWSVPARISLPGEIVARPTVAVSNGFLWIAYERIPYNDSTTPSQIVLRRRSLVDTLEAASEVRLLATSRLGTLNPLLTEAYGQLWLDWPRSENAFGYIELRSEDLEWTAPRQVPWTDPSWLGVEDVRQTIRRRVQSPNTAVVPLDPGPTGN